MPSPTYTILYVRDLAASTAFYSRVLGMEPPVNTPHFVMFPLPNGHQFALWLLSDVTPETTVTGGGAEMAFPLEDAAAVDRLYAAWAEEGIPLPQAPTDMDFGRAFVALDPDGHRLRMMALNDAP